MIAYVHGRGIPAALPIPARGGHTVVERGGLLCALYEQARGQQLCPGGLSLAQASAAGEVLAALHRVTRALPDEGFVRWNLSWNGAAWVERLDAVERAIARAGVEDETDDWALRRVRAQRAWLRDPAC